MEALRFALAGIALLTVMAGVAQLYEQLPPDDQYQADGGLTYERGLDQLGDLLKDVTWRERHTSRVKHVQLGKKADASAILPAIDEFPLLDSTPAESDVVSVELFVTTHLARNGANGLFAEIAEAFNRSRPRLRNGRVARITMRAIPSGIAYEYIATGKHIPAGFVPVHGMWAKMAAAKGVAMQVVRNATVSTTAGVVMKNSTYAALEERHGVVDIRSVIDEVALGDLAMGYTNPFVSSTGLNFLITVLSNYAQGKESEMLSPAVVSSFEQFQRGVPFVALTTLHMRESVKNDGSLDAFIMSRRTFGNTPELQAGYRFVPFGVAHDHPIYAVGESTEPELEVLEQFAAFAERPRFQQLAATYRWDLVTEDNQPAKLPAGTTLLAAQKLWKAKKDAGATVSAVFVCDISGSMAGSRIRAVQESLVAGAEFISSENAIGLVLFDDTVTTVLPIKPFGIRHKGTLHAAISDIHTSGGTAMYDAILVGLRMLTEHAAATPTTRPMLFVLTDGHTNEGHDFETVEPVIKALKIPVYTIGYEADLAVLQQVSGIVEAVSIKAREADVGYAIGSLLNAQM